MYEGFDAALLQILLQLVAAAAQHGVDVEHALRHAPFVRQAHQWVGDMRVVKACHVAAAGIVGIEAGQFHVERGRLYLGEAAVDALHAVHVFLLCAVVGKHAHRLRQFLIVGSHAAAVAECAEVLAGIHTERCGMAHAAGLMAASACTVRLCRIFEHHDAPAAGEGVDAVHRTGVAIQMHGYHRPRLRREVRQEGLLRHHEVFAHITKHGAQSCAVHRLGCCHESQRGHAYFIAVAPAFQPFPRHKHERQRVQSVGHADAMPCAHVAGEVALESGKFLPMQIASARHNGLYPLRQLRLKGG